MLRRMDKFIRYLFLLLFAFPALCFATEFPMPSEWTERGTVLETGPPGAWDDRDVQLGCVVAWRDSFYMFYSGCATERPEGDCGYGKIGMAVSGDGVNFTKYSGNPIQVYSGGRCSPPDDEEVAEFPQVAVTENNLWVMFWAGNEAVGGCGGSNTDVDAHIFVTTSVGGPYAWGESTKVIDAGEDPSREIWPTGVLYQQGGTPDATGKWHLWVEMPGHDRAAGLFHGDTYTALSKDPNTPIITSPLSQTGNHPIYHPSDDSITMLNAAGPGTCYRDVYIRYSHIDHLDEYSPALSENILVNDLCWRAGACAVADTAANLWRFYYRYVDGGPGDIDGSVSMMTAPGDFSPGNRAPTASFTADPVSGVVPLVVDFDASASSDPDGDNLAFDWTVKEGTSTIATGGGITWQYTFQAPGTYGVFLVVTDDGDPALSDTLSKVIQVQGQLPPVASFTADPQSGVVPLTVDFDASASSDPNGDDLVFDWTVKEGSSTVATGGGITWQYTFQAPDTYDVFLVVTDDGDPALSDTVSKAVDALDQFPPVASFTGDPMSGTFPFPLQVGFDASASHDPDGVIVSYGWDFGDGSDTLLATSTVSHVYAGPGQGAIPVVLTVTDDDGATDSDSHNLNFFEAGAELEVTDLNRPNYQVSALVVGDACFVDRYYTIADIPQEYEGLLWIKTANDDKANTSEEFLTFTVNQDVTAYVAYDDHASSLPFWITSNYADTGDEIEVNDLYGSSSLSLWARDFSAGTVAMGGNMASGASGPTLMYLVILRGQGSSPDVQAPLISQVTAAGVSDSGATIQWTTDEPADSRVEYGLASGSYDWYVEDPLLTLSHSLELTGLTPATQYHYRVRSQDAWGNASASQDNTFVTAHELPMVPGRPEHFDD